MSDLPPGKWSMQLVGAWWPAPPTEIEAAVTHWATQRDLKWHEAENLENQRRLLSVNQGKTAEDLQMRYRSGIQRLRKVGDQCEKKREASHRAAEAITHVRDRLKEIAREGNSEIDRINSGKGSAAEKVAKINEVLARANEQAALVGQACVSNILYATQSVLNETIGGNARTWMRDHGANLDNPPPRSITAQDLDPAASSGGLGSGGSHDAPEAGATGGGGGLVAAGSPGGLGGGLGREGAVPGAKGGAVAASTHNGLGGGVGRESAVPGAKGGAVAASAHKGLGGGLGRESAVPGAKGGAVAASAHKGLGGGLGHPAAAPTTSGGAPVAHGGEGLHPATESVGKSFTTGMQVGHPAAAGGQSVSAGAVHAAAAPSSPQPSAVTVSSSSVAAPHVVSAPPPVVGPAAQHSAVSAGGGDSAVMASPTPVVSAPPVGALAAPAAVGGPVSAGPLPAYGADLRPPVVSAPSVTSSVPAGPAAGAPVAPSSGSTHSAAGGSLVSSVDRSAPAGAGSGSGAATAGAGVASAAAGAVAGDAGRHSVERQAAQRKVDAVARQMSALEWAAGIRDDGKTLLVTDLACGWIPPVVKLPVGVALLAPARRRSGVGAVGLLGPVAAAAVFQPRGYVAKPGLDDVALTGDRVARQVPDIDELGPALVDLVRRRDGLPRWVQTVARAASRGTGIAPNEFELLAERLDDTEQAVLGAYPNGGDESADQVVNWMLLAAIEALLQGHKGISQYHLAWALVAAA